MRWKKIIMLTGIIATCFISMGCVRAGIFITREIKQDVIPEGITASVQPTITNVENAILTYNVEQVKKYSIGVLLAELDGLMETSKSYDFTHLKQTRNIGSFYIGSTPVYQNVILDGEDGENRFTISLPWEKNEGFVQMTELIHEKISYFLEEAYERVGGEWKLRYLSIVDYSYSGLTAYGLADRMREMEKEGDGWAAICYKNVIASFNIPGFIPQYDELWKEYKPLAQEIDQSSHKLPLEDPVLLKGGPRVELISMDGFPSNYGIGLLLYCVTDRPLSEEAQLNQDAKTAVDNYIKALPVSDKYFDFYTVRQYHEKPTDPQKTYQYYATTIFTHDKPEGYEEL